MNIRSLLCSAALISISGLVFVEENIKISGFGSIVGGVVLDGYA